MAQYISVIKTSELQPGERTVIEVNAHWVAVFRVGDIYYAIEDVCTHDDGPLAEGELDGVEIACPRHGARFDITTGKRLSFPATKDVPRYATQIVGDDVQILI